MTSTTSPFYFRRRTIGRAASPPTWACYEQIPYDGDDYSDSCSDSCSEDEEDYARAVGRDPTSDSEDGLHAPDDVHDMDMDIDEGFDGDSEKKAVDDYQKDAKGKQRAVDSEQEPSKPRHRKKREPVYTLRPILTIHKSQGFVWNQVSILYTDSAVINID